MERNLLLVDDEENILRSLKRTLRRDGYNIYTADGGAKGLEILDQQDIGVIVSDQRMPGMIGAEFLSKARERYPTTVRIMLSGYTELNSVPNPGRMIYCAPIFKRRLSTTNSVVKTND